MDTSINYNGQIFSSEAALFSAKNRAFRYGDGIFETIKICDGSILYFNLHFERLLEGMMRLKMEIPAHYNIIFFEAEIRKIIFQPKNYRLRLSVFRCDGGYYAPLNNTPLFLIEATEIENSVYKINDKGLTINIFEENFLQKNYFTGIKSIHALPYILANIYCKEYDWDDAILLNTDGYVAEATSANVFLVKNNQLFTPPISEGGVDGVMRKVVLEIAKKLNYVTKIVPISLSDLCQADEVFLTNVIQGLRWVESFENAAYTNQTSLKLVTEINKIFVTKSCI